MDAPFPEHMMPAWEKFFHEVHPNLTPGQDSYPEVFASNGLFPLQRRKELEAMMQLARGSNPRTVMEIGSDKGGGLYHWCMSLPSVENVVACEIRGTPYRYLFSEAFDIDFCWPNGGSLDVIDGVEHWLNKDGLRIDVLFIDGDKNGMLRDFDAYLPIMRRPGGLVFIHDYRDPGPDRTWLRLRQRGYRTAVILDESEGLEAAVRVRRGNEPMNEHDAWLAHWEGRSCGVGVVYL